MPSINHCSNLSAWLVWMIQYKYSSTNEFYGHEPTFPPPSLCGPLVRFHMVGIQSSEDQIFFKTWIMILPEPLQEGKNSIPHKWLLLLEGTACASRTEEAHDEEPKESEKLRGKSWQTTLQVVPGCQFSKQGADFGIIHLSWLSIQWFLQFGNC